MTHSLDFLLLASSLFTALEHPDQGNYNAANAFLEAFCQQRHNLHLPTSVLSVRLIDRMGFFATHPATAGKMKSQGFYFVREQAFLTSVAHSLSTSCPSSPPALSPKPATSPWFNPAHTPSWACAPATPSTTRPSWRRNRRMRLYHNVTPLPLPRTTTPTYLAPFTFIITPLRVLLSLAQHDPDMLLAPSGAKSSRTGSANAQWSIDCSRMRGWIRG
ncbi:MAG: polyketide synthase [Lasallia pustulata]|uniref:Polyketide synthase n=1 Tax=Lasallia pustulata TaxID=136370 RepID=A0A5M8PMZ0_9LECA|nr:MAG: polyketide synthase [Lasallia pustulata]